LEKKGNPRGGKTSAQKNRQVLTVHCLAIKESTKWGIAPSGRITVLRSLSHQEEGQAEKKKIGTRSTSGGPSSNLTKAVLNEDLKPGVLNQFSDYFRIGWRRSGAEKQTCGRAGLSSRTLYGKISVWGLGGGWMKEEKAVRE